MKKCFVLLAVLALACLCASAMAEQTWLSTMLLPATEDLPLAEDITQQVLLNGEMNKGHLNKLRDGNYRSIWESYQYGRVHELFITPPEGKAIGGMVLKWRSIELPRTLIQVENAQGEWETIARGDNDFVAQYVPIPATEQRIRLTCEDPSVRLQLCEIIVLTPGRLPEDFQLWQKPPEKVDLLQIVAHPDDEVLWFGGLLPTYAGDQGKDVLVACSSFRNYHRRLELLDGLWTAGVKYHPIFVGLADLMDTPMLEVINAWGRQRAQNKIVELYRQYKPDVVALQDTDGEYGHGVHRALTNVSMHAVEQAADPNHNPEEVAQYGVWNVPKVYIHLWPENQIKMDWHQPLAAFGGKTGLEMAVESFKCHVTQQNRWSVEDGGEYDNSLFGLWHTTVGPDVIGGDMFENIDKLYAQNNEEEQE